MADRYFSHNPPVCLETDFAKNILLQLALCCPFLLSFEGTVTLYNVQQPL